MNRGCTEALVGLSLVNAFHTYWVTTRLCYLVVQFKNDGYTGRVGCSFSLWDLDDNYYRVIESVRQNLKVGKHYFLRNQKDVEMMGQCHWSSM